MAEAPSFEEVIRLRVVLSLPGMEGVRVEKNRPYRATPDGELGMDVYAPPGGSGPRPFVLLVHGGPIPPGLSPKDWGTFVSMGELLAASGFVALAFNHRFTGAERLLDAQGDVDEALRSARSAVPALDPERGAVFCYSGGGVFLSRFLAEPPSFVKCLVGYYPCLDIREPPEGRPDVLGPELRRAFSPALAVHGASPPLLLARAGLDQHALNRTIDLFVEAALRANAPLELLNHPGGRHGFDILDAVPRSREILERTLGFLALHLG